MLGGVCATVIASAAAFEAVAAGPHHTCHTTQPPHDRSGDGGQGEIVQKGRGKWVSNNKYHAGGNQPKKIWLPASECVLGPFGPRPPPFPASVTLTLTLTHTLAA